MAFFSDGTTDYFSLSLDPAGENRFFVFRLTERQMSVARTLVQVCFYMAAGAILAIGLFAASANIRALLGQYQSIYLVATAGVATTAWLCELGFYFWVCRIWRWKSLCSRSGGLWGRFTASSALDRRQRRLLGNVSLRRKLSFMAYASALLVILVLLGALSIPIILPAEFPMERMYILDGMFRLVSLSVALVFVSLLLIRRLFHLLIPQRE